MVMVDPAVVAGFLLTLAGGIVGAGIRRVWVFGWTLQDEKTAHAATAKDRDFWRDTALKAIGHTGKAIDVVARDRD